MCKCVCACAFSSLYRTVIQLWGEETLQLLYPGPPAEGVVLRRTGKVARMIVPSLGHWGRIYSLIPLYLAADLVHGFMRGDSLGIIEQTGELGGFTIQHRR